MERLTFRTNKGHAYLLNVKQNEQEVDSKYPNTLQCILDAFEKLAVYEDAEEQGRLVVLPCKVGERWLDTQGKEIEVDALHCDGLVGWSIIYHYTDGESCACNHKYFAGHYTRKEAEAALEVQNG